MGTFALQTDEKLVLVGSYNNHWAVMRLNPDGSPDSTFALTTYPLTGNANAVSIQADGKIVVGGTTDGGSSGGLGNFGVLRINPDGTRDSTFDGDGVL